MRSSQSEKSLEGSLSKLKECLVQAGGGIEGDVRYSHRNIAAVLWEGGRQREVEELT